MSLSIKEKIAILVKECDRVTGNPAISAAILKFHPNAPGGIEKHLRDAIIETLAPGTSYTTRFLRDLLATHKPVPGTTAKAPTPPPATAAAATPPAASKYPELDEMNRLRNEGKALEAAEYYDRHADKILRQKVEQEKEARAAVRSQYPWNK